MSYATINDVQVRMIQFKIGSDENDVIDEDGVTNVLNQITSEINNCLLSLGLLVPVEARHTEFLGKLKSVCADGAAALILKSVFPAAEGPQESPAYAFFEDRYTRAIKSLKMGSYPPELETTASRNFPSSYFVKKGIDPEPMFTTELEF